MKRNRAISLRQPIVTGCALPIVAILAVFYLNVNGASDTTVNDGGYDCETLVEMMQAPEVTATESGLRYLVLVEGDGPSPSATSNVTVHYRGCLPDGTEFDSSYSRGMPMTFPLDVLIFGWTKGVQLMSSGSTFIFYMPPELAYGETGSPPRIPANSSLIFEIKLLGFQ